MSLFLLLQLIDNAEDPIEEEEELFDILDLLHDPAAEKQFRQRLYGILFHYISVKPTEQKKLFDNLSTWITSCEPNLITQNLLNTLSIATLFFSFCETLATKEILSTSLHHAKAYAILLSILSTLTERHPHTNTISHLHFILYITGALLLGVLTLIDGSASDFYSSPRFQSILLNSLHISPHGGCHLSHFPASTLVVISKLILLSSLSGNNSLCEVFFSSTAVKLHLFLFCSFSVLYIDIPDTKEEVDWSSWLSGFFVRFFSLSPKLDMKKETVPVPQILSQLLSHVSKISETTITCLSLSEKIVSLPPLLSSPPSTLCPFCTSPLLFHPLLFFSLLSINHIPLYKTVIATMHSPPLCRFHYLTLEASPKRVSTFVQDSSILSLLSNSLNLFSLFPLSSPLSPLSPVSLPSSHSVTPSLPSGTTFDDIIPFLHCVLLAIQQILLPAFQLSLFLESRPLHSSPDPSLVSLSLVRDFPLSLYRQIIDQMKIAIEKLPLLEKRRWGKDEALWDTVNAMDSLLREFRSLSVASSLWRGREGKFWGEVFDEISPLLPFFSPSVRCQNWLMLLENEENDLQTLLDLLTTVKNCLNSTMGHAREVEKHVKGGRRGEERRERREEGEESGSDAETEERAWRGGISWRTRQGREGEREGVEDKDLGAKGRIERHNFLSSDEEEIDGPDFPSLKTRGVGPHPPSLMTEEKWRRKMKREALEKEVVEYNADALAFSMRNDWTKQIEEEAGDSESSSDEEVFFGKNSFLDSISGTYSHKEALEKEMREIDTNSFMHLSEFKQTLSKTLSRVGAQNNKKPKSHRNID